MLYYKKRSKRKTSGVIIKIDDKKPMNPINKRRNRTYHINTTCKNHLVYIVKEKIKPNKY